MKNSKTYLLIAIFILSITACTHDKVSRNTTGYSQDNENKNGLNCAADGPGCQQFNPNL